MCSSPNTPGLRNLQAVEKLAPLLGHVRQVADAARGTRVPLLVKIAPDLADDDVLAVADLALDQGLDGIIATNTTISRDGLRTDAADVEAAGAGGLSGAPLKRRSTEVIRLLRDRVGPDLSPDRCGWHRHGRRCRRADRRGRHPGAGLHRLHLRWAAVAPSDPERTAMTEPFGVRCAVALADRGPFCVGIDPHPRLILDWGYAVDVAGLERFALGAVEAVAPYCSVVKPQSAFYERFGSRGIAVLERVIAEARAAGALVLLDVKRGDIGSTSQAYAEAYLDPASPLAADAITVSPYLGFGSLLPFVDGARQHGAGIFVLAATSNKEGPEVQDAVTTDEFGGRTVATTVLDHLRELNAHADPLGSFGAVVGATIDTPPDSGASLDFAINGPILAPGYGEQGGTAADIRRIFGASAARVIPSSSRGVLRLGPDAAALRAAVERVNLDLADVSRADADLATVERAHLDRGGAEA